MSKYVTITGNIGVGKTTLLNLLKERWVYCKFFDEDISKNHFLEKFYQNKKRWAFHNQMTFLALKLTQHMEISHSEDDCCQDRSVFEDVFVFTKLIYQQNYLTKYEYECYKNIFDMMSVYIKKPDLIIYLTASTKNLLDRINKRGLGYEKVIGDDYLSNLELLRKEWLKNFNVPCLEINTSDIDITTNEYHKIQIIEKIEKQLQWPRNQY